MRLYKIGEYEESYNLSLRIEEKLTHKDTNMKYSREGFWGSRSRVLVKHTISKEEYVEKLGEVITLGKGRGNTQGGYKWRGKMFGGYKRNIYNYKCGYVSHIPLNSHRGMACEEIIRIDHVYPKERYQEEIKHK